MAAWGRVWRDIITYVQGRYEGSSASQNQHILTAHLPPHPFHLLGADLSTGSDLSEEAVIVQMVSDGGLSLVSSSFSLKHFR